MAEGRALIALLSVLATLAAGPDAVPPAPAADDVPPAPASRPSEAPVPETAPSPRAVEAQVEVVTTRLPKIAPPKTKAAPASLPQPPEPRTLPQALAAHPSAVLYDQTGNGLEPELDLRGFSEGTATAVLLDGVRWNEPDDNRFDAETIPFEDLSDVGVRPGAAATALGSGAAAGALLLSLRDADTNTGGIRAEAGSFGSHRERMEGSAAFGRGFFRASATRFDTDGFRENGDGWIQSALARGGGRIGKTDFRATALRTSERLGEPGALTADEWREDPSQAPYNRADSTRSRTDFAVVRTETAFGPRTSLSASASWRGREIETLATGRTRSGFRTETGSDAASAVAVLRVRRGARRPLAIEGGIEAARGRVGAKGEFTDAAGDGATFASDTKTVRETLAVFAMAEWRPAPRVGLEAGVRFDREDLRTDGESLDPSSGLVAPLSGVRRFDVASPRLAIAFHPRDDKRWGSLVVALSQAALLPTPTDLFAYPTYGSNPGLRAARVREASVSWAIGDPDGRERWSADAVLWRSETRDETYFVTTGLGTGRNENIPSIERQGIEATARVPLGGHSVGRNPARILVAAGVCRASFGSPFRLYDGRAVEEGDRIPLVPAWKAAVSAEIPLPRGFEVEAGVRATGPRFLQNDEPNDDPRLGSYALFDAAFAWRGKRVEAFAAGENLLDRTYATRGIAHVPDENYRLATFYTPAPGRTLRAGLTVHLGRNP